MFPDWTIHLVDRYGDGGEPEKPGTVRHLYLSIDRYKLAAMDSAQTHDLWRKAESGWKVWRRRSTPLSAGELPTAQPGDKGQPFPHPAEMSLVAASKEHPLPQVC